MVPEELQTEVDACVETQDEEKGLQDTAEKQDEEKELQDTAENQDEEKGLQDSWPVACLHKARTRQLAVGPHLPWRA